MLYLACGRTVQVAEMDESGKLVETTSQEAEPKPNAIVEQAEKSTATNVTGNYFI